MILAMKVMLVMILAMYQLPWKVFSWVLVGVEALLCLVSFLEDLL
jgi:hypothetical protein